MLKMSAERATSLAVKHAHVQVGWKHQEAVKTLEEQRKERAKGYWEAKKKLIKARQQAVTEEA